MTIDWNAFTPWSASIGGMLIGLAAAMFALLNGRIAGISGVLGGLFKPTRGDVGWRVAFIGGLIVAPLAYAWICRTGTKPFPPECVAKWNSPRSRAWSRARRKPSDIRPRK